MFVVGPEVEAANYSRFRKNPSAPQPSLPAVLCWLRLLVRGRPTGVGASAGAFLRTARLFTWIPLHIQHMVLAVRATVARLALQLHVCAVALSPADVQCNNYCRSIDDNFGRLAQGSNCLAYVPHYTCAYMSTNLPHCTCSGCCYETLPPPPHAPPAVPPPTFPYPPRPPPLSPSPQLPPPPPPLRPPPAPPQSPPGAPPLPWLLILVPLATFLCLCILFCT